MQPFLIFIAILIAACRPLVGHFSPMGVNVFKDLVHLYVGGMFAGWFVLVKDYSRNDERRTFKYLAILLTAWEVACFAMTKAGIL